MSRDSPVRPAPAAAVGTPVTAAEAASLADMMRAVVTSGHAGFLASVPGEPVGAKTGTAEFGNDTPPKTHAWIVAVHGDLAVAVFVEDGGLGATTSGPLLKEFLTRAGRRSLSSVRIGGRSLRFRPESADGSSGSVRNWRTVPHIVRGTTAAGSLARPWED